MQEYMNFCLYYVYEFKKKGHSVGESCKCSKATGIQQSLLACLLFTVSWDTLLCILRSKWAFVHDELDA